MFRYEKVHFIIVGDIKSPYNALFVWYCTVLDYKDSQGGLNIQWVRQNITF
jgi:hypothetical protein